MTEGKEKSCSFNEIDAVFEAGKILVESRAEIQRIEDTMQHMAAALGIRQFDSYVENNGIFIAGINREGVQETRVASVKQSDIHLGRIESVNSLSREMDAHREMPLENLYYRLQEIRQVTLEPLWKTLLTYFIGTGCLTLAIGSSWRDSLSSAISSLIMGLVLYLIGNRIHAAVLRTIISTAIVTISANFLCLFGLGSNRGLIILGGLLLLVPGAVFTNAIREFSENNFSTGMTLLTSSVLTCISMSIGVVLATDLLPFADQMTDFFSDGVLSPAALLFRTLMAGIATMAFAVLFHTPRHYYLDQGLLGAISWMLCLVMSMLFHKAGPAIFIPAFVTAMLSRILAVRRKCPRTIFLYSSFFPLLPGLSLYWGFYLLITGSAVRGWSYMHACFVTAFAIALAISIVQEIPAKFFSCFEK